MLLLGLAGNAAAGKTSVANYLAKRYGFLQINFSDALYAEVAQAYSLSDDEVESVLRLRETKETPSERLALRHCADPQFVAVARSMLVDLYPETFHDLDGNHLSPRHVLQWWGTEYRRDQDHYYWVKRLHETIQHVASTEYPEHRPNFFAIGDVRYENERDYIKQHYGNIWHIRRDVVDAKVTDQHRSAKRLPVQPPERELYNNDTLTRLHMGVDMMLRTADQVIKIESQLPESPPQ